MNCYSASIILVLLALPSLIGSAPSKSSSAPCGKPVVQPEMTKIVGGVDAIPYSWPWQIALMVKSFYGLVQICGASLISDQWVMAAAHCFYPDNMEPHEFAVKMGVYNKTDDNENGEKIVDIAAIYVHPRYGDHGQSFDIALLKLASPVKYTDHISPICLPSDQDEPLPPPGTDVSITGWGTVKFLGEDSETLKQVTIPLVNHTECQEVYEGALNEPVMFCAGLKEGGKDSCQGDSGGPLVYLNPRTMAWQQLGIVSWGYKCASPGYYGVYSKVSAYTTFIKEVVCPAEVEFCNRSPADPTIGPVPPTPAASHASQNLATSATVALLTLLVAVNL